VLGRKEYYEFQRITDFSTRNYSGIGLQSSILFASEGANVLLVDINLANAEKGAKIISERYPNVKALATKADVSKEAEVRAAVDLAVQEFGRLDVMVRFYLSSARGEANFVVPFSLTMLAGFVLMCHHLNSLHLLSGIMHPDDDDALNTEERIWDLTLQINLKGVWWGCKYAILAMRNNPTDESKGLHVGGSIINTASFVALLGAATPQLACTLVTIHRSAEFRSID
jgi:NAD(P)-dependent dehydrogenase (short-subunit alcohol dehydrogenase family)